MVLDGGEEAEREERSGGGEQGWLVVEYSNCHVSLIYAVYFGGRREV